jgi:HAD superfamily hydrolase (TIGR01509 family)
MRVEAVLVDLGGVWIQDGDFAERAAWAAAHGTTADALWATYLEAVGPGSEGGRSEQEVHRRLAHLVGIDMGELPDLLGALHAHEILDPTITDFLKPLRPDRKVGVITNAGPSARRALYAKFPFHELIDLMVVSAEEGVAKPHPDIYLATGERLGVDPAACVFIDDKPANVEGARGVGMQAIHFLSPDQAIDDLQTLLS